MSSDLIDALAELAKERNIDEYDVLDRLEQELAKSYQHILKLDWDARVTIDRNTGKIYVYELVGVGEEDPETGEQIPVMDTYWFEDGEVQVGPLTQEEYDAFMRLYESCNSIYSYDEAILNIIKEEIEPFFDGQKTAEETARLIQNRVSLYVAEQG